MEMMFDALARAAMEATNAIIWMVQLRTSGGSLVPFAAAKPMIDMSFRVLDENFWKKKLFDRTLKLSRKRRNFNAAGGGGVQDCLGIRTIPRLYTSRVKSGVLRRSPCRPLWIMKR